MIRTVQGYGIMITSQWGRPLKGFEKLYHLIHHHYHYQSYLENYSQDPDFPEYDPEEDYDHKADMMYSKWLFLCPTAEQDQLALGFETSISKNTDFKALDEQWHELMKALPEEIAKEVKELGLDEPDIVEMSGKC